MLVLVSGGRVGVTRASVAAVLDRLSFAWPKDTVVLHGNARGTDRFAGMWASDHGFKVYTMSVDEALDGSTEAAPKNRNTRMAAQKPDCLIAFPGGPGTKDMIEKAERAGIPIFDVEIESPEFRVWHWKPGGAKQVAMGVFQ